MTETAEPIILVKANDADRKPMLYACPKCGHCFSPKAFACSDTLAHETARRMAIDCSLCKTHNVCTACGEECNKPYTKCSACRRKKAIADAEVVEASTLEHCFGLDSGNFYHSPEEAADDGEEYVFDVTFRPFEAPLNLYETILADHHEDADFSDLVGYNNLEVAINEFNKSQTSGSYEENRKRIALVKQLPPYGSVSAGEH